MSNEQRLDLKLGLSDAKSHAFNHYRKPSDRKESQENKSE